MNTDKVKLSLAQCQENNRLFIQNSSTKWKPIKGYEEKYIINEYGRVRSLDRIEFLPDRIRNGIIIKGFARYRKGIELKQRLSNNGRKRVELNNMGYKVLSIHRLVYEAFVGNIPKGKIVHHKDHNKLNNHYSNLQLMTYTEHNQHHKHPAWNKGLSWAPEIQMRMVISRKQTQIKKCKQMYDLYQIGMTQKEIAKQFKKSRNTVCCRIKQYKEYLAVNKDITKIINYKLPEKEVLKVA